MQVPRCSRSSGAARGTGSPGVQPGGRSDPAAPVCSRPPAHGGPAPAGAACPPDLGVRQGATHGSWCSATISGPPLPAEGAAWNTAAYSLCPLWMQAESLLAAATELQDKPAWLSTRASLFEAAGNEAAALELVGKAQSTRLNDRKQTKAQKATVSRELLPILARLQLKVTRSCLHQSLNADGMRQLPVVSPSSVNSYPCHAELQPRRLKTIMSSALDCVCRRVQWTQPSRHSVTFKSWMLQQPPAQL